MHTLYEKFGAKDASARRPYLDEPLDCTIMKNIKSMTSLGPVLLCAALPALALPLATAGCKSPVAVQGQYSTPKQTINGSFNATTNSVTVGGTYQTGTTNIGGTVTVGK